MKSGEEIKGLVARFDEVQRELMGLLDYVKSTRESLSVSTDRISDANEKLTSIGEATETAAHNLLGLVERAMGCDEAATAHLQTLEEKVADTDLASAVEGVSTAQDERTGILTEMMMELSFQDLTCQTLEKVMTGLNELESRILHILDPESSPPVEHHLPGHAGSNSGLSRLQEKQQGENRQDLVDELLKGL